MEEEFPTVNEVHNQVQMSCILERKLQFHDERMVQLLKYVTLSFGSCDLICFYDKFFFDGLHRVDDIGSSVIYQVNFTIAAPTYYFQ